MTHDTRVADWLGHSGASVKESGASKMVTNRVMPDLTMLKYIKRRLS